MNPFNKLGLMVIVLFSMATFISGPIGCASQKEVNMPIVLLTDFGSEDYRISQLKGIIFNNNPSARLVDASHSVPAFDIPTGAFILDKGAKEFPENVVFVGVIAPYAQQEIKYLVVTTSKNQFFVLPDNGLITYVGKNTGISAIYQVTNQNLFKETIKTLSAERIEGTIGALIATGYRPNDVGVQLSNPKMLDIQEPSIVNNKIFGTVVYVDHYGNCITNISGKTANEFGVKPGDAIAVNSSQIKIPAKFGLIYSDVPKGKEIVFVNNNLDILQLSMNLDNFANKYSVKAGTKIEIEK